MKAGPFRPGFEAPQKRFLPTPRPSPGQPSDLVHGRCTLPPKIAQEGYAQAIMTKMSVRQLRGEPMEATLDGAEGEVEGFMRT